MEQSTTEVAEQRAYTDASLGAERTTADMDSYALAESSQRILDDLIERDRLLADCQLSKYRNGFLNALWRERFNPSYGAIRDSAQLASNNQLVKVERGTAEALLRERRQLDVADRSERHEHDALREELEPLRQATNDRLSAERQDADSVADALGRTRAALSQAQSGNARWGEVLAMVSHDLRSPLSVILLNTENIVGTTSEPSTLVCAQSIMRGIARMERLLGDLLDVARIESGTLSIVRRQHDIGALLLEVLRIYQPLFASRKITFTIGKPVETLDAFFDHDRIIQVLSNLLGNAMKFTPSGGSVELHAEREDKLVAFALHNDGAGISPSDLPHIFERFWQSENEERRGLGLGLNICRTILEAHGGKIWAESEPGEGAVFRFTLPIR